MLRTIIKKEILTNIQTFRFVVSMLLCLLLIPTSMFVFGKRYQHAVEIYDVNRRIHEHENETRPHTWFRMVAGIKFAHPPEKLGIFASGLDDHMTGSYKVSLFNVLKTGEGPSFKNPLRSLFPKPDLLSLFTILGSLLALLFLHDTVCGERVNRTLAQTLSNGVSRGILLLGQFIGNFIIIIIPFLAGILAGFLLLALLLNISFGLAECLRIAGFVMAGLVYLGLFCCLGLLISVISQRPGTALVISLAVWCLVVILMPGLSTMISRSIVPMPSAELMEAEKTYLAQEYEITEEVRVGMKTFTRPNGGTMHTPHNPLGSREGRGTLLSLLMRREEAFEQNINKSEFLLKAFSRLSPSSSLISIGSSLAQTGVPDLTRFRRYWWTYRSRLMDFYENKIVELSEQARSLPGYENWLWSLPPEEKGREMETGADDIPMPQYPVWDAGLWINQSWIDIVLLFVWGASFFLIALVMFIRSNVL